MARVTEHLYIAATRTGGKLTLRTSTITPKKELLKPWVEVGSEVISLVFFSNQGYGFLRPLTADELKGIKGEAKG
jgi:hypothetical protein